jgi:hypothetical protein
MALPLVLRLPDAFSFASSSANIDESPINPGVSLSVTDDGRRLAALAPPDTVDIYDTRARAKLLSLAVPGVLYIQLSPCGTYLATLQRHGACEGQPARNLKVWDVASQAQLLAIHQKQTSKESWPSFQWASDDSHAAHMVTNTIHVYTRQGDTLAGGASEGRRLRCLWTAARPGRRWQPSLPALPATCDGRAGRGRAGPRLGARPSLERRQQPSPAARARTSATPPPLPRRAVSQKVPVKGVNSFAIAPGKPQLAAFVPEAKGAPAVATVLDFSSAEPSVVCRRSFFRANGGLLAGRLAPLAGTACAVALAAGRAGSGCCRAQVPGDWVPPPPADAQLFEAASARRGWG